MLIARHDYWRLLVPASYYHVISPVVNVSLLHVIMDGRSDQIFFYLISEYMSVWLERIRGQRQ